MKIFYRKKISKFSQFVNNNSTIVVVKDATESVYRALIRSFQKLKEIAVQLSHPEPIFDHLRILLRDESKFCLTESQCQCCYVPNLVFVSSSMPEQHLLRLRWSWIRSGWRFYDWNVVCNTETSRSCDEVNSLHIS